MLYHHLKAGGRPVEALALNAGIGIGGACVQSFALALRNELKDTGVTVTSLMPGLTDTNFFERADMMDTKVGTGSKDDPAEVAHQGFEALMAGEERVVAASVTTKAQGIGSRLMPDGVKAALHRSMAEPGSADDSKS